MKIKYSMGIMNYCSHHPACSLIKVDGNKIETIFAEEGFLSRKKKSYQFPLRSIKYCLDYFSINIEDVDILMLDYMDKKRYSRTSNNYRLLIGDYIRSRLKINHNKIKFANSHHYAHALTAFWPSMLDESAVLIIDGLGSQQQTHSVFYMNKNGKVDHIFEQKGGGIGELYSLITNTLNFEVGEEGKTMGLAPYGKEVTDKNLKLPLLKGDYYGLTVDYSRILDRHPSPNLKIKLRKPKNKKLLYDPYFVKLAYNLQNETIKCIIHLAKEALKKSGSQNLCFAGGVALNCVANNHIQNLDEVKNFWVQPASGDSGIPFGLALAGLEKIGINLSKIMTKENRKKLSFPYSPDINPISDIYESKFNELLVNNKIKLNSYSANEIATRIADRKVVGLFTQGIELGPRALGHRSFLADARSSEMKDIMNSKIKHREGYRPFAPIVLKNDFSSYFISSTNEHPFMLQAPLCNKKAIAEVPAICHIDKTARVQTAEPDIGKVYDILQAYKKLTKTSTIINTSFNDNAEPMVFTKLDALNSFLRCNADTLVLENIYINREEIINVDKLRLEAEMLQKKVLDSYFLTALDDLTDINYLKFDHHKSHLINFISFNVKLSKSYRNDRMMLKLLDFLQDRNLKKKLIIDEYHYNLIDQLFNLMGIKLSIYLSNYSIYEDCYYKIKDIPKDSDFILYNISGYYHNPFTRTNFANPQSLYSFYDISDKKLNLDILNKRQDYTSVELKDQIINSYEHNKSLSIEDFFNYLKT